MKMINGGYRTQNQQMLSLCEECTAKDVDDICSFLQHGSSDRDETMFEWIKWRKRPKNIKDLNQN